MKKIFILALIFLSSCTTSSSEEVRKPIVAGAFYPAGRKDLRDMISLFLEKAEKVDIEGRILAIIVPHAGYIYSGGVAAHSYKQLKGLKINSAVIICNSHSSYFSGIAIDESTAWETPLGLVKVDTELADRLVKGDDIVQYNRSAHKDEHSLEVQVPFLQTVLEGDFKILPILFGNTEGDSYRKLAQLLARNLRDKDIVVISTDMSHYPRYEDANRIDQKTLEIMTQKDISKLIDHTHTVGSQHIPGEQTLLCGIDGVKTLIELQNILGGTETKLLKYANSGDVQIGDKSRVVGYGSVVIYVPQELEKKEEAIMGDGYLNKEEKQKLLKIAKASIVEAVSGKKQVETDVTEARLKEKCGAFVTIKKHGELRGCIGYIIAVKPLHQTVRDVAKSAAVNDYRFPPVREEELAEIEIEISALTPLKQIKDINEIKVGTHGLYMKRGFNSGLLLPQVATEYGWDRETFLRQTCLKAGLPTDAWKDKSTEIYIFSAEVFGEDEL